MCLFFDPYASDVQGHYASRPLTFLFRNTSGHTSQDKKSFSFFLRAPYILRTTCFSGDNGGQRRQELKPHCSEKVRMACRIRIHGARGLAVGDIPLGTTRWYMGRTIRGGLAHKVKACTTRLQVILDIVIVPNRILYL